MLAWMWRNQNPCTLWMRMESSAAIILWKTVCSFFKKLKIYLLYDPAIPLLGIYPKQWKAGS